MIWTAMFLVLAFGRFPEAIAAGGPAAQVAAPVKTASKQITLKAIVEIALGSGSKNRVPGPLAKLMDVPPDTPIHLLEVEAEQASDRMAHDFKVMVDVSPETKEVKPIGLQLDATYTSVGITETYMFRASLEGSLVKVVVIRGKRDEQNRPIKGSGTTTEQDVTSPETRKRFQHELDLWLKKTHLKKQWRSAEFSDGVLVKKGKAQ